MKFVSLKSGDDLLSRNAAENILGKVKEISYDIIPWTVHSHPTFSEAVMEAAEDCVGIATYK